MAERFPRQARLSGPAQFRFVFSQPDVSRDRCFRVLSRSNDRDGSRLGMAVSVRVCRRATGRNRLRRVIRESFRSHRRLLGQAPRDFVVLPGPGAVDADNAELFRSLAAHWRKHAAESMQPGENGPGRGMETH